MSSLRQPGTGVKEIDSPSRGEGWWRFVRRDTEAVPADRRRKVSPYSQMQENLQVIRAHAKQHRYSLIDRQVGKPVVLYAPGSQGSHGEAEGSWELTAQSGQKTAVKGALRCFRVKVYLNSGDLGVASQQCSGEKGDPHFTRINKIQAL